LKARVAADLGGFGGFDELSALSFQLSVRAASEICFG
jgi:hypothetical protein